MWLLRISLRMRMRKSAPPLLTLWEHWRKWPQYRSSSLLGRQRSPHLHCCRCCCLLASRRRCRFDCKINPFCRHSSRRMPLSHGLPRSYSCGSSSSSSSSSGSINNSNRRNGSRILRNGSSNRRRSGSSLTRSSIGSSLSTACHGCTRWSSSGSNTLCR